MTSQPMTASGTITSSAALAVEKDSSAPMMAPETA